MLFQLLPYFWLVLLIAFPLATVVAALSGPKKAKPAASPEMQSTEGDAGSTEAEPSLDFGDELTEFGKS